MKRMPALFLSTLSAALLVSVFPALSLHSLAWVALGPVLIVIRTGSRSMAAVSSLLAGYLFFAVHLKWGLELEDFNRYNYAVGLLGFSWYFGVFGFAAHYCQRKAPRWNVLIFPCLWAVLEYVRSHIGFLSITWGILGYSQYSVLPVARISRITGVYGVSFLIVAVNAVLAEGVLSVLPLGNRARDREAAIRPAPDRKIHGIVFASLFVLFSVFSLLSSDRAGNRNPSLNVALVQGNIYMEDSTNRDKSDHVFEVYQRLTRAVFPSRPDLIIWPSSSIPGTIPYESDWVVKLGNLARESTAYLLIGSSGFDKFNPEQRKVRRLANSAFLFSPEGKIIGKYDKIRLLPFDEYVPLRGIIRWPSWVVSPDMLDHYPGKELTVFRTDKSRFGVLICWENMFPDMFRELSAKGVDFMVEMTNEGWTHSLIGHQQMLPMYIFRAIENHVSIARTASTGMSGIISPDGEILGRVQGPDGKDVDVQGWFAGQIPLSSQRTFYTRYGDCFVFGLAIILCCFFVAIGIPTSFFKGDGKGGGYEKENVPVVFGGFPDRDGIDRIRFRGQRRGAAERRLERIVG